MVVKMGAAVDGREDVTGSGDSVSDVGSAIINEDQDVYVYICIRTF